MKHPALHFLPQLLPLHAEEGIVRQEISREIIISSIAQRSGLPDTDARTLIAIIESLFDSAALLDPRARARGNWAFVSFPASLMAMSIAQTLATPKQRFFNEDYWEQGAYRPEEIVERQRNILHMMEQQRVTAHHGQKAVPIRFIYVAWGVIKIGNRILMHHREDKTRAGIGNYVFPGGRLNMSDLPSEQQNEAALPLIQSAQSEFAFKHLESTLKRELDEEFGLQYPDDYGFAEWRTLNPYRAVEGARNNHAYTEYGIRLYRITLTQIGELKLFDRVTDVPGNAWFSIEDMVGQKTSDGRTAYIEALRAELGGDLEEELTALPDSCPNTFTFSAEIDAIDFLLSTPPFLLQGKTGKERARDVKLSGDDLLLLWGLGWHAVGLPFSSLKGCKLLPHGWVKILDPILKEQARRVATYLRDEAFPLIEVRDEYVRMDMSPALIHFDPKNYDYHYGQVSADSDRDWEFTLRVRGIETAIGQTGTVERNFPITRNMARIINAIEKGLDPESERQVKSGDIQKSIRDQLDRETKRLGLRKFIRTENASYRIDVARRHPD